MGTDIHVEVQARKGETWHNIPHMSGPFESRDYLLFNELQRLFPETDWYPENVGPEFGICHSISNATITELRLADWGKELRYCDHDFFHALASPEIDALVAEHGGDNVRLVFGFDS